MKNNKNVETAQKGQTTTKNTQPENVKNDLKKIQEHRDAKKSKTPTGKVKLLKETEARKKARKEQYDNFRINALIRRCKRMKMSEEDTQKYVEKLKEQLNSPHSYNILIMFHKNDVDLVKQALKKESLEYKMMGDGYLYIDGDSKVLATIRGIMPPSAKIYPYVMKKPPVLVIEHDDGVKKKRPTKAQKKSAAAEAKMKRKMKNIQIHRNKKTGKVTKRIVLKTLKNAKKHVSSIVVQLPSKKASEGSKMAKKAA